MNDPLQPLVVIAGLAQLALAAASLAIPRVLDWRRETAPLRPLVKQLLWTYAAYVLATHVCFGLVSCAAPAHLLDRSRLAGLVCGFMAAWWGARLALQFVCFDRRDLLAARGLYRIADRALTALFAYLAGVYLAATLANQW